MASLLSNALPLLLYPFFSTLAQDLLPRIRLLGHQKLNCLPGRATFSLALDALSQIQNVQY